MDNRWLYSVGAAGAVGVGLVVGSLFAEVPLGACEFNACVTSNGNCDTTDIPANCAEVAGGCESYPCE